MNKKNKNNDIHDSTTDFFLKIVKNEENTQKKEKDFSPKEAINLQTSKTIDKASKLYNYLNKAFDKILSSNTNIMIISIVMTLILFFTISGGDLLTSPTSGVTLDNIPVLVEGLNEDYEISGVPTTVQVGLIGPSLDIYTSKIANDYEVYLDMSDYGEEGNYTVNLKYRNFPESLSVMVVPTNLKVTMLPKVESNFQLSYQFINESKLDPEFSVTVEDMSLNTVRIRASESTLNKIAKVVACIDVANQKERFEQDAKIKAYDQQGNELKVDILTDTVHVKCQVTSYSKVVSIKPIFVGDVGDGYVLTNYALSHSTVTIYGLEEELNGISEVTCQIDLTDIKNSTSINNVTLNKDDRINKLSYNSIDISLEVEEKITKRFDNIPIKVLNKPNNRKVSFVGDNEYAVVSITGPLSKVNNITADNIQASIDVNNLKVGNRKVDVSVAIDDEQLVITLISSKQISINIERN